MTPKQFNELLSAAKSVVNNADNEGCSDDLTVTSARAVQRLEHLFQELTLGQVVAAEEALINLEE